MNARTRKTRQAALPAHAGELRGKHHRALVIIRDAKHDDGSHNKGGWQDFIIQFPVGFNILPKLGKGRLFNLILHGKYLVEGNKKNGYGFGYSVAIFLYREKREII